MGVPTLPGMQGDKNGFLEEAITLKLHLER